MTTATVAHTLVKPNPGEVAAHQATCSCGLTLTGVARKDAVTSIRRHAHSRNTGAVSAA